jgi:hypothetical protein
MTPPGEPWGSPGGVNATDAVTCGGIHADWCAVRCGGQLCGLRTFHASEYSY